MNAAIREHFRTGSEIVRVVASAWHRRKLDRAVRMFGARHGVRMGISPAAALTSTDRHVEGERRHASCYFDGRAAATGVAGVDRRD